MIEGNARARSLAATSGLTFVVLFAVGNALWGFEAPEVGAPAAEVLHFYAETWQGIVVGASLSLLSIVAFTVFAAAVRRVLIEAEADDVLPTAAFGGALLALAAGLGAESINMVGGLRAESGELSEPLAQSLFETSQILGTVAAAVGIAIFALATATVAIRTRSVLPRWLALVIGLIGLSLLTPAARILEWPGGAMLILALMVSLSFLRKPAVSEPRA
jgi:hypothetical protein